LELGLIKQEEWEPARKNRKQLKSALIAYLRGNRFLTSSNPGDGEICDALMSWLSLSPAEFVQLNLEDLWQECRSQNVPGTTVQRPNWRRKLALTLDELERSATLGKRLKLWASQRKQTASHG
jgi:4-alpha-glucanotransferase